MLFKKSLRRFWFCEYIYVSNLLCLIYRRNSANVQLNSPAISFFRVLHTLRRAKTRDYKPLTQSVSLAPLLFQLVTYSLFPYFALYCTALWAALRNWNVNLKEMNKQEKL
jgi:hypothetical protein